MEAPAFEDADPGSDCDCPACGPGLLNRPAVSCGRPVPPAGRVLAVLATAAAATGAALGAGPAAAAAPHTAHRSPYSPDRPAAPAEDESDTPQGGKAPLHGPGGTPAQAVTGVKTPPTTRAEIIRRAKAWVAARVPYSMGAYWSDGYRQDCSGFVSMAWGLPGNEWTGSLGQFGVRIGKGDLQPGDILLFHNPANPQKGSHVVIFGGWTDHTRTSYVAYEQTPPATRRGSTPYAYWSNSGQYVPYRYKGVTAGTAGAEAGGGGAGGGGQAAYPGRSSFGPGADNAHVTRLGRRLVEKGFGTHYTTGPGPRWGEADRRNVEAFQRAQGWRGGAADGYPGPETWRRLFL
ncbi:peptidoglycan-binding protein [Streptomyces longwoodensis]|uniref:peptidoglycan-binding protein n=1 Tax=Streptomyces longwoodensis TaxID=68231 RepID=UPI00385127F5